MKKKIIFSAFTPLFILLFSAMLAAEVSIISASPKGRTEGRAAADTIIVVFNQPMVALSGLPEGDGSGPLEISPPVEGKFRWQGTNTLSFEPKEPLIPATKYSVRVKKGFISEISSEKLEKDFEWEFETVRPSVIRSNPYHGTKWVELDCKIYVLFNMEMSAERAMKSIKLAEHSMIETESVGIKATNPKPSDLEEVRKKIYVYNEKDLEKALIIEPVAKLKKGASYTLKIKSGLQAKAGDLGSTDEREIDFKTYGDFEFMGIRDQSSLDPDSGMGFIFSNPVKYSDLAAALSVEPGVEFSEDFKNGSYYCGCNSQDEECIAWLNAPLKPRTEYAVKIQAGLKDSFGQGLGNDAARIVKTKDYRPWFSMPSGEGVTEAHAGKPGHPATFLNVNEVRLKMGLIGKDALVTLTDNYSEYMKQLPLSDAIFTVNRDWAPGVELNKSLMLPIDLGEALGRAKYGIVALEVDAWINGYHNKQHAILQVTNLGITGKFSPDNNLIYVSGLNDPLPAAGCRVELRDSSNKLLWEGNTDKDGFVTTPGWEELKIIPEYRKSPKLWVVAEKGGDTAYLNTSWGTGIEPYYFNISQEYSPVYPKYEAHLFTERGIYRPGENVHIKGIIRENRFGVWKLPRKKEYDLIISDSRNAETLKKTVMLSDDFGSFNHTLELGKNAPTGYYSVKLWEKGVYENKNKNNNDYDYYYRGDNKLRFSASFRVEEYKPASFEVTVGFDREEYILGDKADIKVEGRYLFGAPMPEAPLSYSATLRKGYFRPAGHEGYVFDGMWHDERYYYGPGAIDSGEAKLDKNGGFGRTLKLAAKDAHGTLELGFEAAAAAPDRQRLAGRKSAIVHGGEFYTGIKPASVFIEKGRQFEAEIIAVLPSGKIAEKKKIKCEVIRREWNSVRKAGTNGRLEWVTERKDISEKTMTVKSGKKPVAVKFKPSRAGYYIFVTEAKDGRGNLIKSSMYFYVTGRDYIAWERGDDDRVELVRDREKYKPGDTAKIMVKSPYEKALAVVTLEREGIISRFTTEVTGSADTVTIPVTKEHLPNVYVCVMLYQGRLGNAAAPGKEDDTGKPSFKIGYINLPVDPGGKNLKVTVKTDRENYKPGDKVNISIKTLGADGKGAPGEVTVAVVDRAILNLIGYKTPDSFMEFYGSRPLSVSTSETRINVIGQRSYGEKGENRGGGGAAKSSMGIDFRSNFLPTAFWKPSVRTDRNGDAFVSFTLPDNLTSFKVMASAATADSCFGAGDTKFTVSKPVLLKPSLPRFALLGDTFAAGVLCHNNTQKDGTVRVTVKAGGIKLAGPAEKEAVIPANSAKEISFDFSAGTPGSVVFEFTASLGADTDGLKWTIPVKIPVPTEAVATYNSTLKDAKEGIKIPGEIFEEAGRIDISLASTAMVGIKGGLEYLVDYPYECLEQRTSRVLPFILAGKFLKDYGLMPENMKDADKMIKAWAIELSEYQNGTGGFCFWKDSSIDSPYLTAYVLWAIAEAKKRGYEIDEALRSKAVGYQQSYVRNDTRGWKWPYSVNEELCAKAFSVFALSMNGAGEQGYINKLYEERDQMPLFGQAYLIKAMKLENMGDGMINTMHDLLMSKVKVAPTEAHFEDPADGGMGWIWGSSVRSTAVILQAILEIKGKNAVAEKTARWLTSERKSGRWRTTQENIYVFHAFQEYSDKYEKENPDFTAQVLLDGKKIMEESFKGRETGAKTVKTGVGGYEKEKLLPVEFTKAGEGRLYYEFRMIYAPKGKLPPREEGISVKKTIVNLKTGKEEKGPYTAGEKYVVNLEVNTKQDRKYVVMDSPVPAGCEIVNTSLTTESSEDAKLLSERSGNSDNLYRWWGSFGRSEKYDDRVLVFADYLTRGTHKYSYMMQATITGDFFTPATKVEEMYTPEVFGRTGQERVAVK